MTTCLQPVLEAIARSGEPLAFKRTGYLRASGSRLNLQAQEQDQSLINRFHLAG